jgi:glycosyltransferase involved in cell wall biosynthesis
MRVVNAASPISSIVRNAEVPGGRIAVLQVVDTLDAGGAEAMAVNLANALPRERFVSHLATTRRDGALERRIAPDVGRLRLARSGRFDVSALPRLASYVRQNRIQVLHAHGTSLFLSALIWPFAPRVSLVWHDHFGTWSIERRAGWLYGPFARRADAVLVVNETLAEWSRRELRVPEERVAYVPNFVPEPEAARVAETAVAREPRIVCLANFRPQKDHENLFAAMELVAAKHPTARLLLVGREGDAAWAEHLRGEIVRRGLARRVAWLGERTDVSEILRACELGVLASRSEGLPLALIEYGMAGLPAVATRVGQCEEVLESGECGMLVDPGDSKALGEAILALLYSPARSRELAARFAARTRQRYGVAAVVPRICGLYERLAAARGASA